METKFITRIVFKNNCGLTARFKFSTYVPLPLEKAISMAIDEIGLDDYFILKYHVVFYSFRRFN